MEIIGKVAHLLPLVTGQGRNGEWRKQEFVIEVADGQFPKKICFSLWGEKIAQASLGVNDLVKVFFDLESREYNGRWFTEARAWKCEKQTSAAQAGTQMPPTAMEAPPVDLPTETDDLPF